MKPTIRGQRVAIPTPRRAADCSRRGDVVRCEPGAEATGLDVAAGRDAAGGSAPRPLTSVRGSDRAPKFVGTAVALLWICASAALAATPPADWAPELADAFGLYYQGAYLETQQRCRERMRETHDPRVQREAAALAALAGLRLAAREERQAARAELFQLAAQDPTLAERPESRLALGVAHAALHETAPALQSLSQAARLFVEQGRPERAAEAYVALAQAWAEHSEWEALLPGLMEQRPSDPAEAERIRLTRIGEIKQRLAELPRSEAAVAQVELIRAARLLESAEQRDQGVALLEQLAAASPAAAEAGLRLGDFYAAQERWEEALHAYERSAAVGGAAAVTARDRAAAILRPQIQLNAPAVVRPDEPFAVRLRVRNLEGVELELRRVDLAAWLREQQGNLDEARLPATGSVVARRAYAAQAAAAHGWWENPADAAERLQAPADAYALVARGVLPSGETVESRRLLLCSDLTAAMFLGAQRGLIWAIREPGAAPEQGQASAQAEFWVQGVAEPARIALAGGVGQFDLPAEARLGQPRHWVCLIRAGEQIAICRGTLTATEPGARVPRVALLGGPPTVQPGGELNVLGALLPTAGGAAQASIGEVEIELLDTQENAYARSAAPVSGAGTFSARIPIPLAAAGRTLRAVARHQQRVLPLVRGRFTVRVAAVDESPLRVVLDVPGRLDETAANLRCGIRAFYPWGVPLAGGDVRLIFRSYRFPQFERGLAAAAGEPLADTLELDPQGQIEFLRPLADFAPPERPLAVGVWVTVLGVDRRDAQAFAGTLLAPQPVQLWVEPLARQARVGQPLRVGVGLFDPQGLAVRGRPTLEIRCGDALVAQPRLVPTGADLQSEVWRPPAPGRYELLASLPLDAGGELSARAVLDVDASEPTGGRRDGVTLEFEASMDADAQSRRVRAHLSGRCDEPLLLLLTEAGDPLSAVTIPHLTGTADVVLPVTRRADVLPLRVVLLAGRSESVRVLGVVDAKPSGPRPALQFASVPAKIVPGAPARVEAACTGLDDAPGRTVLVARLTDARDRTTLAWLPEESTRSPSGAGGVQLYTSRDAEHERADSQLPETQDDRPDLMAALYEGATLWVEEQAPRAGRAVFRPTLPSEPTPYRLTVAALRDGNVLATTSTVLDARQTRLLRADVAPQMTLGDRTVASIEIDNPSPREVQGRLFVEAGVGLARNGLRRHSGNGAVQGAADGNLFDVRLPAGGSLRLHVPFEAAAAGRGVLQVRLDAADDRLAAEATYRVFAQEASAATMETTGTVRDRRTLFLLSEDGSPAAAGELPGMGTKSAPRRSLRRTPLAAGQTVEAGQLLLVQETMELPDPGQTLAWTQRLPANCYSYAGADLELRPAGEVTSRRLEALEWRAEAPDRALHHEYVLVAVRPGACRLPPPDLRMDGRAATVEADELWVLVGSSER